MIRAQLGATVAATVLYLIGASAATTAFNLLHTYVIDKDWVLTMQVIAPKVASTVMIAPTKTFPASPAEWVGAAVLIACGVVAAVVWTWVLRRRDIA